MPLQRQETTRTRTTRTKRNVYLLGVSALCVLFVLTFQPLYSFRWFYTTQSIEEGSIRLKGEEAEVQGENQWQEEVDIEAEAQSPPLMPSNRSVLLLHVGPPKTGTTTIQELLTEMTGEPLERDGYQYVGSYRRNVDCPINQNATEKRKKESLFWQILSNKCHDLMHQARQKYNRQRMNSLHDNSNNSTLGAFLLQHVPCAQRLVQSMAPYRNHNQSLILSQEVLSFRWKQWKYDNNADNDNNTTFAAPLDWISLRELLQPHGWDVHVAVGYRRYAFWLLSAKLEHQLFYRHKRDRFKWPHQGGSSTTALFPDFYKVQPGDSFNLPYNRENVNQSMPYHYSDAVIASVRPHHLPLHIINMHQPKPVSLQTSLFCHAVPGVIHNCAKSRALDQKGVPPHHAYARDVRWDFYDLLAQDAVAHPHIAVDTTNRFQKPFDLSKVLQQHHEVELNRSSFDFPLLCPEPAQLDEYLNMSLEREKQLLPAFHASPQGEVEHRAAFQKAVDKNYFCSIDTQAVLATTEWQDFFRRLYREPKTSSNNNNLINSMQKRFFPASKNILRPGGGGGHPVQHFHLPEPINKPKAPRAGH